MPEMPLFSVVIATYNCAQYLRQAIDSALAQTFKDGGIETIVIDDGSTDDTPSIARAYGNSIRYVHQENAGVSAALNHGISLARGKYIAILDADDYCAPRRLEAAYETLREGATVVVTDMFVEVNGVLQPEPLYRSNFRECLFELDAQTQLEFALEDNFINSFFILPATVYRQVGRYDESLRYGEDWDMALRMLSAGIPIRLVREPLYYYRLGRPGATTTRHDYGMACNRVAVLSRYRRLVTKRRWQSSTGYMHHLGLKKAVHERTYGKAFWHAFNLSTNVPYLRETLNGRLSPQQ